VTPITQTQSFPIAVTLSSNTTYFYRIVFGTGFQCNTAVQKGSIVSFKTLPFIVTTLPVSSIGSTSATLNGSVNSNGTLGCAYYEFGTDPGLVGAGTTSSASVLSNSTVQSFPIAVTLSSNTTYFYRIVFGTGFQCNTAVQKGSAVSFKTSP
jgi:hypothetical protein